MSSLAGVLGSTGDTMTYPRLSIPYLAAMFALLYGRAVGVGRVHHAVAVWLHLHSCRYVLAGPIRPGPLLPAGSTQLSLIRSRSRVAIVRGLPVLTRLVEAVDPSFFYFSRACARENSNASCVCG